MAETTAELISRLVHKRGGIILLVGGGVDNMMLKKHPQLLLWDDRYENWEHREIPANTRVILWNRWISHSKAKKLHTAAEHLRALKFPLLKTREIRELLSDFLKPPVLGEQQPLSTEEHEVEIEKILVEHQLEENSEAKDRSETTPETPATTQEEEIQVMRKPNRGEIPAFLAQESRAEGTPSEETRRLLPMLRKQGIKQSEVALLNHILRYRGRIGDKPAQKTPKKSVQKKVVEKLESDTFIEAEKMLQDAQATIQLLIEFIPKLRKETADLRAKQAKIKALIDD